MSLLLQYIFFLLKLGTLVLSVLIVIAALYGMSRKTKEQVKSRLYVKRLNKKYHDFADVLRAEMCSKSERKKLYKERKIKTKERSNQTKKRVFVLSFQGDIKGLSVGRLSEEVTAILQVAQPQDEVVVKLESGGGMVSAYGLAASQLQRLKNKCIPLTIVIDKIAASGGYLMACVADKIFAAPFAIIGSIGVVAQLPNLHRFLKKRDIDFELLTAGEYKRTLTVFGENTEKARKKTQSDLDEIHRLFKKFIETNRKKVDIDKVATGEHWLAEDALSLQLVDELCTSDDYLMTQANNHQVDIYEVRYLSRKSIMERFGEKLEHASAWLSLFR